MVSSTSKSGCSEADKTRDGVRRENDFFPWLFLLAFVPGLTSVMVSSMSKSGCSDMEMAREGVLRENLLPRAVVVGLLVLFGVVVVEVASVITSSKSKSGCSEDDKARDGVRRVK